MTTNRRCLEVFVPLRTVSEANRSRNEHWARTRDRVEGQHLAVTSYLRLTLAKPPALPLALHLTRVSPRKLDRAENLPASFKAVVDAVCKWVGCDDRDERLLVSYAQRKAVGKEPKHGVVVQLWPGAKVCPACCQRGWVAE